MILEYFYLIDDCFRRFRRWIFKNRLDQDEAKGIIALGLVRAANACTNQATFKGYAIQIIKTDLLNYISKMPIVSSTNFKRKPSEPYVSSLSWDRESDFLLTEKVLRSLNYLSRREKIVITLYYLKSKSIRYIASRMRISQGQVHRLHSRALQTLREICK